MKKQEQQNFELIFIKPIKVKVSKANKKGNRNLLIYLNHGVAFSLSEAFIKAVFSNKNKKPQ